MDSYYLVRLQELFRHADLVVGVIGGIVFGALLGGAFMHYRAIRKKRAYRRDVDTEDTVLAFTGYWGRHPMTERLYTARYLRRWRKRAERDLANVEAREARAKRKLDVIEQVIKGREVLK